MNPPALSMDDVVNEIMKINRSLPIDPDHESIKAARVSIRNVDNETNTKLEAISKQTKADDVPQNVFNSLIAAQKNWVFLLAKEQKRAAEKLIESNKARCLFSELAEKILKCIDSSGSQVPSPSGSQVPSSDSRAPSSSGSQASPRSKGSTRKLLESISEIGDSSFRDIASSSGAEGVKLSMIDLASLIEVSARDGRQEIKLDKKLDDDIECLPDSIGKLLFLNALELSNNQIRELPLTIGRLKSLTKLDLSGNRLLDLPKCVGDLTNLVHLNLRENQLTSLPHTFSGLVKIVELDLSTNNFIVLPTNIGSLARMTTLKVNKNNMEEIPYTIGGCQSLREFQANYNRLKRMPESLGSIQSLQILSVKYNHIQRLEMTVPGFENLKEINMSFNELEAVPEPLCWGKMLVKMNIGNNFASLECLPDSIGDLADLEELDIMNNQIKFLPGSFGELKKLRILLTDGNPLVVPPEDVAKMGAEAVVKYMQTKAEKNAAKGKSQSKRLKKLLAKKFSFLSNKSDN